jgi:hypothetical protein
MATTLHGPIPEGAEPSPHPGVVLFSIGGRRVGACADEIAGFHLWGSDMSIPSRTPFVNRLLRYGDDVLAVYDLAARLKVRVVDSRPLCLIARHQQGRMAICIDAEIPTLRPWDVRCIGSSSSGERDVLGTYQLEAETIPIYSLATLGIQDGSDSPLSERR